MKLSLVSCFLSLAIPGGDAFISQTTVALQARSLARHSTSSVNQSPLQSARDVRRPASGVVPSMAWGDDIVWSKATIAETNEVATEQRMITIKAGDITKEYDTPGQYVQIRVGSDGKPGFYAIASPPSTTGDDTEGLLDILVKETDTTRPLIQSKTGATVEISPVMGKGFPIKENFSGYKYDFPIQNVILSATGTGIAPFRAAIESGALELPDDEDDGVFGRSCKLYWGCKDEESMPWKEKLEEWDARGVEVVPVLSEPSSSWTGRKGYVQEAIKEDGIRLPRNSGVLVCGHAQMGEEVKALALSAGVLDGRVLSNF